MTSLRRKQEETANIALSCRASSCCFLQDDGSVIFSTGLPDRDQWSVIKATGGQVVAINPSGTSKAHCIDVNQNMISIEGALKKVTIIDKTGRAVQSENSELVDLIVRDDHTCYDFEHNCYIEVPEKITKVATGWEHRLILTETGNVYGYGRLSDGQLGPVDWPSESLSVNEVIKIDRLSNIISIACTGWSSAVLNTDGEVWCFGFNSYGQCGKVPSFHNQTEPHRVDVPKCKAVVCGLHYTICLTVSGELWSFGAAEAGQLGLNRTLQEDLATPTRVVGIPSVASLCCHNQFVYAVTDNDLYYWGGSSDPAFTTPLKVTELFAPMLTITSRMWRSYYTTRDALKVSLYNCTRQIVSFLLTSKEEESIVSYLPRELVVYILELTAKEARAESGNCEFASLTEMTISDDI